MPLEKYHLKYKRCRINNGYILQWDIDTGKWIPKSDTRQNPLISRPIARISNPRSGARNKTWVRVKREDSDCPVFRLYYARACPEYGCQRCEFFAHGRYQRDWRVRNPRSRIRFCYSIYRSIPLGLPQSRNKNKSSQLFILPNVYFYPFSFSSSLICVLLIPCV